MPLTYTQYQRLQKYRAKPKFKPTLFQHLILWLRAVVSVLGVALNRFKLDGGYENNYDEYSDRSDRPEKWYRERYPVE